MIDCGEIMKDLKLLFDKHNLESITPNNSDMFIGYDENEKFTLKQFRIKEKTDLTNVKTDLLLEELKKRTYGWNMSTSFDNVHHKYTISFKI